MKKRRIIAMMLVGMTCGWVWGEVTPSANLKTYYASIDGKSGTTLREALTTLTYTKHTTTLSYDWTFDGIDVVSGEVLDIYSTCEWTPTTDQCGNYNGICGCYNREHIVPQNTFNEVLPQKGDRHHLFLTDGKVNGVRSNYAFGETNVTSGFDGITNADKALGKFGTSSNGYSGKTVYEPDDQYKGDVARAVLYMVIRYATASQCANGNPVTSWTSNDMFSGSLTTNYGLVNDAVTIFLKWHKADPVSEKERNRNEGVEDKQGNRNPFIDFPELVDYLWGDKSSTAVVVSDLTSSYEGGGGGETTYTDFLTDCAPAVQYTISFYDNLQHTDGYYPEPSTQKVNEGSTFTFPSITDIIVTTEQKTSGTCEQRHYHFMGWVIEADKSHPTDDNIHASKSTSAAVTGAASYYAVWAREAE